MLSAILSLTSQCLRYHGPQAYSACLQTRGHAALAQLSLRLHTSKLPQLESLRAVSRFACCVPSCMLQACHYNRYTKVQSPPQQDGIKDPGGGVQAAYGAIVAAGEQACMGP